MIKAKKYKEQYKFLKKEYDAVYKDIMVNGYDLRGPYTKKLEDRVKKITGRKYVSATISGTGAIWAAIYALDLFGGHRLIQKNHKEYTGKIHKKRRLVKGMEGNSFYSACYLTADNRWFDNSGMPIEAPKNSLDEEVKESNVEIVRMPPSAEELEQIKQQKLAHEQRILQNLK